MKSVLRGEMYGKGELIKEYPADFKVDKFLEKDLEIDNINEKGTIKTIKLRGVRIILRDIKTIPFSIEVSHDFPFFKLQFEIEGSSLYTPKNSNNNQVYISNGSYNLFYIPKVDGVLTYNTTYRKTVEIVFTEWYLKTLIGNDFKDDLVEFGKAISNKEMFKMWENSMPISVEMKKHLEEIIDCKYTKGLKEAYLRTKINELLLMLLAKTNEKDYKNKTLKVSDSRQIIEIENYIRTNIKKELTINELSLKFGISVTKLKNNFKTVYSRTIFKHLTFLRMDKAKKMLEKGIPVSEVSYDVGYRNPQHFTVAFKKTYKVLPSIVFEKK
jgi:AraC-like DNA-binding protein